MKAFIDDDFMLHSDAAKELYHRYSEELPIIDYHCHLPPDEIAADRNFRNISEVWLAGDHYKWRAMRANGVDERYCTGDASDRDKFVKWAETVPYTLRNPLYHWTHLELKRYFGVSELLHGNNAEQIYYKTTEMLQQPEFSVRNLLRKMNVETVCTTDDPTDDLQHHKKIREDGFEIRVLPAWRPDKAMAVEDPVAFNAYINKLEGAAGMSISSYSDLFSALKKRHDFFHENGCRLSDHGMEQFYAEPCTDEEAKKIFAKIRSGKALDAIEILKFKSVMLYEFALLDHSRGWVQQFHVGAIRNNNRRRFNTLGPDKGYDSIGDFEMARAMSALFDRLDSSDQLAKTIVYNLNPRDNELLMTMIYNFSDGVIPGKMQFGSGWWFLDQKFGMTAQLNALSSLGLLSRFVGMLTDSRSFLSYPRHEYFRRILCNLLGTDIENGELPNDVDMVGRMVKDISYYNAKKYFGF
ncbi:MAG: glucuronate isomerase [Bacteroidota bacterium]